MIAGIRKPAAPMLTAGLALLILIAIIAIAAPVLSGGRDPALVLPHERALAPGRPTRSAPTCSAATCSRGLSMARAYRLPWGWAWRLPPPSREQP